MFIAIEGLVGIGKSTLQKLLSSYYTSQTLIQNFEHHPYLEEFYLTPQTCRVESMMVFLLMGFHQLRHVEHQNSVVISDFTFDKFDVFAQMTLSREEYESIFVPCYKHLYAKACKPDLVIWLRGTPDLALTRVAIRGRQMEQNIKRDYLRILDELYSNVFSSNVHRNILQLDAHRDVIHSSQNVEEILGEIEAMLPHLHTHRVK